MTFTNLIFEEEVSVLVIITLLIIENKIYE